MGVIFDPTRRCYISTTTRQRLSGLHNVLSRQFYRVGSNHSTMQQKRYKKGKKNKDGSKRKGGGGLGKLIGKGNEVACNRTPSGMGKFIDEQMNKLVTRAAGDEDTLRVWTRAPNQTVLVDASKKIPPAPKLKYHNYVKPCIRAVLARGLVPISCQLTVGSEERRVATDLDMLAWDKQKKQVAVIELKSGYEGIWTVPSGKGATFNAPLDEVPDTPNNKAHLQALSGALLYRASRKTSYTPDAYVLHVDSTGVTLRKTPEAIAQHETAIANRLTPR